MDFSEDKAAEVTENALPGELSEDGADLSATGDRALLTREDGREERNRIEAGTLYLVATPIGNLDDLSARALKVLEGVDFIAAEDTRVTARLLSAWGVTKECMPYHEHNKAHAGEVILERLRGGQSCALVTDAGTPGISDPGADLARLCIGAGLRFTAVPGCCAMVDALVLSGFDTRSFCFLGFLDAAVKKRREEQLETLRTCRMTAVLYEAPHRLRETLALLLEALGDRKIALCRELTKRNEEVVRISLSEAAALYETKEPRGEYVLILERPADEKPFWEGMDIPQHVAYYTDTLGMDAKSAMKAVAADRGVAKNVIYKALL